ncbi:MAG: ATP-binding cassette domain-containing protein [Pseudomonadota bacterium]
MSKRPSAIMNSYAKYRLVGGKDLMISCELVTKNFRIYKKPGGFAQSIRSLWSREFHDTHAVRDFDLQVKKGEIVGLLGPNGAGKTTLMKMFTGIIVPTSGQLRVMGYEPAQRGIPFRKKIALVMGQKSQLWWDIPAIDSFLLLKAYYEIPSSDFRMRLNQLASVLQVEHLMDVHVRKLSLGERMKMELIASLLHRPEIIFLDEPTIGLDVISQKNIREFLISYQKQHGTTIILTSHYMADVEALCGRIVLILEGRKRFDGPIVDFGALLGREKFVSLVFSSSLDRQPAEWESYDPQWNLERTKVELRIPEKNMGAVIAEILTKFPVVDFYTEKLPIERVLETLLAKPQLISTMAQN